MPRTSEKIKLNSRSTYILPTRYGLFYGVILYGMLMGSINYSNNLGFLLTFLLAGLCLVGMLYTFRNLIGISVTTGKSAAVFAGDTAIFNLWLESEYNNPSYAIAIGKNKRDYRVVDIGKRKIETKVHVVTTQRGLLSLGRIRIWSEFPLALFQVWSWLEPDASVIVYPKPSGKHHLKSENPTGEQRPIKAIAGHEDFSGVRRYHHGDSPRHIDWKAVARGHPIFTKQFSDPDGGDIWLDWDQLPSLSIEQRLSQLCQWVLDLHRQNRGYGLRMPGVYITPNRGEAHKHYCLQKLALFRI